MPVTTEVGASTPLRSRVPEFGRSVSWRRLEGGNEMSLISRSVATHREPGDLETFRSDEQERPIGPARGIFYAMLFGAAIWIVLLGAVEGLRHLF